MQGIYTYIPEINYVPREYSVAAILLLLFMVFIPLVSVLNPLYVYISMYFPKYVCSAQYGYFLQFLAFMFSWYVAHLLLLLLLLLFSRRIKWAGPCTINTRVENT